MTVAELIDALKQFDPELPVLVRGYEFGSHELGAELVRSTTYDPRQWCDDEDDPCYGGPHQHDDGTAACVLVDRPD